MVDKNMLENIRNIRIPELRKYIETCDEEVPTKATSAMLHLAIAYKGDAEKVTEDPLYHEIHALLDEFRDTCACTKFGKKKNEFMNNCSCDIS